MSQLVKLLVAAAMMGSDFNRNQPFSIGVTSALPHDPERLKKAQEKQARKAAKRALYNVPDQQRGDNQSKE